MSFPVSGEDSGIQALATWDMLHKEPLVVNPGLIDPLRGLGLAVVFVARFYGFFRNHSHYAFRAKAGNAREHPGQRVLDF